MQYKVMYLRDKAGQPVGCVAINMGARKRSVEYQLSVRNPVEKFDKAFARQLALGRLVEVPHVTDVAKDHNVHDLTKAVMSQIESLSLYPSRARKAARLWLRTNTKKAS